MNNKKILSFALMAIAVLSLIFAISCFAMESGDMYGGTERQNTYGADFYTDVQNATAQAANNVYYLGNAIEDFASCITTIAGFVFIITALTFGTFGYLTFKDCKKPVEVADSAESEPAAL